jgi:hypothetical protein
MLGIEPNTTAAVVYVNQCNLFNKTAYTMAEDTIRSQGSLSACELTYSSPNAGGVDEYRCTRAGYHRFDYSHADNNWQTPNTHLAQSNSTVYWEMDPGNGYHDVNKLKCTCGGGEIPGGCVGSQHVGTYNIGLP